jgi:hypothetical protein
MNYIFGTGTMRTGGSLVLSIMEIDSKTQTLCEIFYFSRHIYKKYKKLNLNLTKFEIAHEFSLRLNYRNSIKISPKKIYNNLLGIQISNYNILYQSLANILLEKIKTKKKIVNFVDYSNGEWRFIKDFLKLNKKFKSFLVIRDPRSVISSFKKLTFAKNFSYLNAIFNWIDCAQHYISFSKKFSSNKFLPLKFEDIHSNPYKNVKKICKFLNLPFNKKYFMVQNFKKINDKNLLFSAHSKDKVYGFDEKRSDQWKNNLDDWEIALIEFICSKFMKKLGYKSHIKSNKNILIRKGIKNLKRNNLLKKRLDYFLLHGEGTDSKMNDPSNPKNWGSKHFANKKFSDDPEYKSFVKKRKEINLLLKNFK